jgi:hypothetical protein
MSMKLSKYMPDAYKSVARMIGSCALLHDDDLTDTAQNWHDLTLVLTARLTTEQRAAMAWAVLRSLPPETVVDVANTVLPKRTFPPIPPLFNHVDEAAFWADMAEPEAREAYCLASFNAMPDPRKAAFLEFLQGRQMA